MASSVPAYDVAVAEAHGKGLGNREIARFVGCHHSTVKTALRRLGLVTNNPRGIPPERIDDEFGRCGYCGQATRWEEFALLRSHEDGRRLSKCRKCRGQAEKDRLSHDLRAYLRDKANRAASRSRRLGVPFDLTGDFLHEVYQVQEGLCFYTDIPLSVLLGVGRVPNALSIDRVESSGGYTRDNVVLCTDRANRIKRDVTMGELTEWMPGWAARVEAWRMTSAQVAEGRF